MSPEDDRPRTPNLFRVVHACVVIACVAANGLLALGGHQRMITSPWLPWIATVAVASGGVAFLSGRRRVD